MMHWRIYPGVFLTSALLVACGGGSSENAEGNRLKQDSTCAQSLSKTQEEVYEILSKNGVGADDSCLCVLELSQAELQMAKDMNTDELAQVQGACAAAKVKGTRSANLDAIVHSDIVDQGAQYPATSQESSHRQALQGRWKVQEAYCMGGESTELLDDLNESLTVGLVQVLDDGSSVNFKQSLEFEFRGSLFFNVVLQEIDFPVVIPFFLPGVCLHVAQSRLVGSTQTAFRAASEVNRSMGFGSLCIPSVSVADPIVAADIDFRISGSNLFLDNFQLLNGQSTVLGSAGDPSAGAHNYCPTSQKMGLRASKI